MKAKSSVSVCVSVRVEEWMLYFFPYFLWSHDTCRGRKWASSFFAKWRDAKCSYQAWTMCEVLRWLSQGFEHSPARFCEAYLAFDRDDDDYVVLRDSIGEFEITIPFACHVDVASPFFFPFNFQVQVLKRLTTSSSFTSQRHQKPSSRLAHSVWQLPGRMPPGFRT